MSKQRLDAFSFPFFYLMHIFFCKRRAKLDGSFPVSLSPRILEVQSRCFFWQISSFPIMQLLLRRWRHMPFQDGGRCVNVSLVGSLGERIWQNICRFRHLVGGNWPWSERNNIWWATKNDTAVFYLRSACSQSADNFSRKCQIGGELED